MNKLLIILGPTATGKTDLGLEIARKINGELVACDSRQVYIGLDIGTGKMPGKKVEFSKHKGFWMIGGIRVWMYDLVDPNSIYDVKEYIEDASSVIEKIQERGRVPIIVGGTGFYLQGLLEGIDNLQIPADPELRELLSGLSLEQLQEKLKESSTLKWESLNESDRKNKVRLVRAIELVLMSPYKDTKKKPSPLSKKYKLLNVGLMCPKDMLNNRIDKRVISRINLGMIEEARDLNSKGLSLKRMRQLGLEYGVLADLIEGLVSEGEFIVKLQNKIHQYAKRQMTWFKRDKNINWFDISESGWQLKMERRVLDWYNTH